MEVEKDNSSQSAEGVVSLFPKGIYEALQQKKLSCVTLKEFKKQGIKELKVISQKSLEELINLTVEGLVAMRLDKEKEARIALEAEVSRLRKELEVLKKTENARPMGVKADRGGKLKEKISEAIERAKESLGAKDIPMEFIRNLEESLLRGLEAGLQPSIYSAIPVVKHKAEKETRQTGNRGGFFDGIIKENLQLRGNKSEDLRSVKLSSQ